MTLKRFDVERLSILKRDSLAAAGNADGIFNGDDVSRRLAIRGSVSASTHVMTGQ